MAKQNIGNVSEVELDQFLCNNTSCARAEKFCENTIDVDALTSQVPRSSAAMVLTRQNTGIVFHEEGFQWFMQNIDAYLPLIMAARTGPVSGRLGLKHTKNSQGLLNMQFHSLYGINQSQTM